MRKPIILDQMLSYRAKKRFPNEKCFHSTDLEPSNPEAIDLSRYATKKNAILITKNRYHIHLFENSKDRLIIVFLRDLNVKNKELYILLDQYIPRILNLSNNTEKILLELSNDGIKIS